jgi:hypothetical protein
MPAGLTFQLKIITTLSLVTLLLSACSRDNPLSIPAEYIETPESFCLKGGPYADFTLLESIDITNTIDSVPISYPIEFNNSLIELNASFLRSHSDITPKIITDSVINPDDETENVLIVTQKVLKTEFDEYLTNEDDISSIIDYSPEVLSLSVSVDYPKDGSQVRDEINEDRLFVTSDLDYGKNTIVIKVAANVKVPRTFIDCETPLTAEEIDSTSFEEDDRYKFIIIIQSFPVDIIRNELKDFETSELTSIVSSSENDQFGRVLSIDDNFLVIGVPNEDTLAPGVVSSDKFTTNDPDELFIQNEDSVNSGAVYIFQKSDFNTWSFHSFIKSSNSESGDLFGSAVSLYGDTLVISAPGEDSIASGINLSFENETENLKSNNLASSSGAVYLFEYDKTSNSWFEKYYIKPEANVISDGDYNKGFGSQLALYKNKLLISAPLEDSVDGVSNNSDYPDSGAVYTYTNALNNWTYSGVLKALNPGTNDKFGSAISLDDNFIAVSSPFEDRGPDFDNIFITNKIPDIESEKLAIFENNAREDSGSVYIFNHSLESALFSLSTHIKPSNSDQFDFFGSSLEIRGGNLFVGAIGEDSSGKGLNRDMNRNDLTDSGAVYMFNYSEENNIWVEGAYIKANDSQAGASFGKYLVVDGDNLFISSPLFDSSTDINAGKAYFYNLSDSSIVQELLFQDIGTSSEMRFGSQMTIHGGNIVIGASGFIKNETGLSYTSVGTVFTYE